MTSAHSDAVEREVRIAARPETIFPFFVEPEKMMRWKGISADAAHKSHEAMGINLGAGDGLKRPVAD